MRPGSPTTPSASQRFLGSLPWSASRQRRISFIHRAETFVRLRKDALSKLLARRRNYVMGSDSMDVKEMEKHLQSPRSYGLFSTASSGAFRTPLRGWAGHVTAATSPRPPANSYGSSFGSISLPSSPMLSPSRWGTAPQTSTPQSVWSSARGFLFGTAQPRISSQTATPAGTPFQFSSSPSVPPPSPMLMERPSPLRSSPSMSTTFEKTLTPSKKPPIVASSSFPDLSSATSSLPSTSATPDRRKSLLKLRPPTDPTATRDDRVRRFFRHGLLRHDQRIFQNRGLPFDCLASPARRNLGNALHITQRLNRDLDLDRDQSVPPPSPTSDLLIQSIAGEAGARASPEALRTFRAAEQLIRQQFAEKNVAADLGNVLDADFTVDVAFSDPAVVLGAVEYVLMRRYLWIDALAVDSSARRRGVGTALVRRCVNVARARGKKVLCFALVDVAPWYERLGFRWAAEEEFPREPWHIGRFMIFDPRA